MYHIWGHGWIFCGGVGNSGLKANLISTSTVITSSNYHNSPAYLMRLITWACLLSISRGCVASPVICTEYRHISFQSAVVVRLKWIAIQQCRNLNASPLTIVRRHLYKMYINYDSLDQHMALEMKWMLNCIEPFPYAAWAYNNSPAFGLRNIAYDLSLDSAGLHLPVSISFESLYLQISLSPVQ